MRNKKKYNPPNMSKVLVFMSILVFIVFTIVGFVGTFMSMSTQKQVVDVAVFVTAITISGTSFTYAVKNYYKKSGSENLVKIQATTYKQIMDIRLNYNEKMLQLKQKYNVSNEEISDIENESPIDDISENLLMGINNSMESKLNDINSDIDFEN